MAFEYKKRSSAAHEKRATQQGGEFAGFIKDEFKTFTPAAGENWIRILPPAPDADMDHYGLDVWVHYGIGPDKGSVICLNKMSRGSCCVCDERRKAERAGDKELADELKPGRRVLVWILNKKGEDPKQPIIWAMSWTLDRDIVKVSRDRETGEWYLIDHPDEGYDVIFDRDGEGLRTKYTGVSIARKSSRVAVSALDYITDHPLPDVLLWRTNAEVRALFEGGDGEAAPADDARPTRRGGGGAEDRPSRRRDDDEDERPARRSARDEEDDRPARRTREDDDDDRPRSRPTEDDDDRRPGRRDSHDDDDDRPRRQEAEDDRPARRRDDDEAPRERAEDKPPPQRRTTSSQRAAEEPPPDNKRWGDDDRPAERPSTGTSGKSRADDLRAQYAARNK